MSLRFGVYCCSKHARSLFRNRTKGCVMYSPDCFVWRCGASRPSASQHGSIVSRGCRGPYALLIMVSRGCRGALCAPYYGVEGLQGALCAPYYGVEGLQGALCAPYYARNRELFKRQKNKCSYFFTLPTVGGQCTGVLAEKFFSGTTCFH